MLPKTRLQKLYKNGLSMMEIANKEGLSNSGVAYLMNKYGIKRRSRSEATYVKRNPNGDPFRIKKNLSVGDLSLRGIGLGLYWGEGDKSQNTQIRMSNTDPRLIKNFREFLTKIYGVKKPKFKYSLVIFNDGNEIDAIKFWKRWLGIKESQLGKIIKIPPQGKGTYKRKNKTGVLTLSVSNKKLKEILLKEIELLN
jgi:hypothetical protein